MSGLFNMQNGNNLQTGSVSDFEMTSPDRCESDEQIANSTVEDTASKPSVDAINELENNSSKALPKPR